MLGVRGSPPLLFAYKYIHIIQSGYLRQCHNFYPVDTNNVGVPTGRGNKECRVLPSEAGRRGPLD